VIEQIPLPGARGRAVDTDWSAQVRSGGISRGDVEALLQFRAACDWVEAVLNSGELDAETESVLRDLPRWSAIRGSEVGRRLGASIEAYFTGDDGPLTQWAATNCVERPSMASSRVVEPDGIEPTTSCLQSRRSPS
jgi:hypothetical protein